MKVDFAEVKLIPLGSVLRHYQIEARRQGDYLVAACPLPTHTSKDSDTFKVSVKENWWTCFSQSCRAALKKNGGDVIDFVKMKEGISNLEAAKKLAELFAINQNAPREAERNGQQVGSSGDSPRTITYPTHNKPLGFTLQADPSHPMIQSRGISIETARSFGIGYYRSKQGTASMDDRIIFPLMEDGVLVAYIGRATLPNQEPKWRMGAKHKTMLFGLERCDPAKMLIVCESAWGVLYFFERGHQCASLLGSEMTEEQERRLEPYGTIILAMDSDEQGKAAAKKIGDRLKRNHHVIRSTLRE